MDWNEIKVSIPCENTDEATAICQMTVPYGVYIEDYSDLETEAPKIAHIDLIDEELLKKDKSTSIIHIYIEPDINPSEAVSFLKERFESLNIKHQIEVVSTREEDWATAWKKYYHPTKVGQKLVVCPTWEEYTPADGEVVMMLDPGMAFGTGTHDTTRLCMQLLEEHVNSDTLMLDIGTGSGILSVAAALLGAKHCVGCDIDSLAVRTAGENAQLNKVENVTEFVCGDLAEKIDGTFDTICANIVADVIIRLSPDIPSLLKEDGVFIASGIIDERADDVIAALDKIGFECTDRRDSGGWVALCAKRKAE